MMKFSTSTLALAMAMSAGAYAQDTDTAEDTNVRKLGTITVTAQFVEQDVQDTPIALTALSGDMLELRGQADTTSIGAQSPNVQLQPGAAFNGNSLVAFIRGVGQPDFSPALEPGVGMYIDDVYLSTVTGTQLDLLDIDRIEILRGPQGTLAGKNSIGGAIKLFSERPSAETNGYVEVEAGDFNLLKLRGGSNFTLIEDKMFARVSGVSHSRDGYVDTYDFGCLYPNSPFANGRVATGCKTGTLGGIDTQAARAALRWLPTDKLEINLSADFVDDNSESVAEVLIGYGDTTAPVFDSRITNPNPGPPFTAWSYGGGLPVGLDPCVYIADGSNPNACPTQVAALGGDFLNSGYVSFGDRSNIANGLTAPNESTLESRSFTAAVDYDISDTLQLQSITSYREYDSSFGYDTDHSPVAISVLPQRVEHEAITQEIRLNGEIGDRATYTVGGFYSDAETTWTGRINLNYVGLDFLHGPDVTEATNYAVFANTIVNITDNLELAAGVRFSDDEKSYDFLRRNPDQTEPLPCIGPPGTPGNPPNCLLSGLNAAPAQVFADDRLDYRAALSYKFNTDTMVYGSVTTGYKAGGANARPFFLYQALSHNPEEVLSYEIGAKTELLDNTLRLNGAVFVNEYSDVILTLTNCTALAPTGLPGAPCLLPANAGEADVKGFEVEFDWAPNDWFYLDGSYSYIDFEYSSVASETGLIGTGQSPSDLTQPFTPETTWSIGAQFNFDLFGGQLMPRLDAVYQDDIVTLATPPQLASLATIEDRILINGALRWTSADEDWVVALEGKNLSDEYYYHNINDLATTGGGTLSAVPGMPRTFQVSVRRNF